MTELHLGPRFWSKVRFGRCFEWQGFTHKGYGRHSVGGRQYRVHRLVWEVLNGPIPDGLCVLHYCDNRRCVNPRHLWLGTAGDNDRDMVAKGRNAKGEANGQARLTTVDVLSLRADFAAGIGRRELALKYGISEPQVYRITVRKKWAHV